MQTRVIRSPHSCRVQAGSNNSVGRVRCVQPCGAWPAGSLQCSPLYAALCVQTPAGSMHAESGMSHAAITQPPSFLVHQEVCMPRSLPSAAGGVRDGRGCHDERSHPFVRAGRHCGCSTGDAGAAPHHRPARAGPNRPRGACCPQCRSVASNSRLPSAMDCYMDSVTAGAVWTHRGPCVPPQGFQGGRSCRMTKPHGVSIRGMCGAPRGEGGK